MGTKSMLPSSVNTGIIVGARDFSPDVEGHLIPYERLFALSLLYW